jgi:hypothetical protein
LLYIFLAIVVITLLRNQVFQSPDILVPAEESVDTDSADQTTEKDA